LPTAALTYTIRWQLATNSNIEIKKLKAGINFTRIKPTIVSKINFVMLHFIFRTLPLSFFNVVRLSLFVVCLAPAFARFAWYYFVASDRISLPYGSESIRQRVDVYRSCKQTGSQREGLLENEVGGLEEEYCSKAPVVIFFTGGGWMIGYKMWGTLLAKAFTAAGIVVVIPDTRNYPLVYVQGMIDDADMAIGWTMKNIAQYGGDPTNIVVAGQSAGGHIASMAIFRKIQRKIARENAITAAGGLTGAEGDKDENLTEEWLVSDLKGFAAASSPLSLDTLITQSFQRKGFDEKMVDRMFGFEKDLYDPLLTLKEFSTVEERGKFAKELPPISIYHGTEDKTVPNEVSEAFYRELSQVVTDEKSVSYVTYVGWSHTDLTVEGPMDGDHRFHKDLFDDVNKWTSFQNLTWSNDPRVHDRLCPHFMVKLSRLLNPF